MLKHPALIRRRKPRRPSLRWFLELGPSGDGFVFQTRARARAHRRFLRAVLRRTSRVVRLREDPPSA